MLKKTRIVLAAVVLLLITLLFLGVGHDWWGFLAKVQFLPAALALNVAVVAAIVAITILFGRIYCSVLCPLGIFQDLASWISRRLFNISAKKAHKKKWAFHFKKEHRLLRYGIGLLTVVCIAAGVQVLVALIAPYSAYGRIVRAFIEPRSWQLMLVALITLATVTATACLTGRGWCNAVCPVGTTLSFFSRFAIFKPVIDESKCVACHGCEKVCKASCLDSNNRKIDYSRCVDCFDCIDSCKVGAISFKAGKPQPCAGKQPEDKQPKSSESRRAFIVSSVLAVGAAVTAKAQEMKVDGGLAEVLPKINPQRSNPLVPFGAGSVKNFYSKCTACQLCVSACPNGVLRPSTDLSHLMQPTMGYDKGYCRPECTKCSDVCPSGAILPLKDGMEKFDISIGVAEVQYDLCIVEKDGQSCGNCARHCPVGAIRMVKKTIESKELRIPTVIEERCIGCGACENLCPSRPLSAITVNGRSVHKNKEA